MSNKAKGTVVWTPVKGEGNALVSGNWKIKDNKKSTGLTLQINGDLSIPLPGLMKMVETYIANLTKKFGGEV